MTEAASDLQHRLGLTVDPFAPRALPNFFFVGGQRRFLAQRAVHALYFSGGVVLLSGARGLGKSRMLDEILVDLRDLTDSCRIDATLMMDDAEVRRAVVAKLGLPASAMQDNTTLIVALTHWQPAGREPHPVALIIDDAHLLAVPVLAECLLLARGSGGRLRLLLAGEPDLIVACEQAGAEALERIELPALDRQETADYVATRLQAAGLRAESPLSAAQLRDLYQHSGGNFGAIHEWLPTLFATPAPPPRTFLQRLPGAAQLRALKDLPLQHVAIAGGLLLVVVLMVLNRGGDAEDPAAPVEHAGAGSSEQRSIALALPTRQAEAPAAADRPAPADAAAKPAPVEPAPQVESTVRPQTVGKSQSTVKAEPIAKTEPAPKLAAVPKISGSQKITLPAVAPKVPVVQQNPAASPPVSSATPVAAVPVVAPPPAVAPTPAATTPAAAARATATELTADERELLSWSNKQFALQLLGAGSSATVAKFMRQSTDATKLYAYQTELNGRPWFIVVSGPYASRNAATAAAETLPPALRNQKPWPRAMKNIHADIKQRK